MKKLNYSGTISNPIQNSLKLCIVSPVSMARNNTVSTCAFNSTARESPRGYSPEIHFVSVSEYSYPPAARGRPCNNPRTGTIAHKRAAYITMKLEVTLQITGTTRETGLSWRQRVNYCLLPNNILRAVMIISSLYNQVMASYAAVVSYLHLRSGGRGKI